MHADPAEVVRRFISAVEAGATGEALAEHLATDVLQREWPNPFAPAGRLHDRRSMLEASERGAQVVTGQRYEITGCVANGETVAVELDWSASLKVDTPKHPAGHRLRAHIAMFFRVRDGKIHRITHYDCYEP